MCPAMVMMHEEDPRREILDKVGALTDFDVLGNWVLVGIYIRPTRTKSGLYLADSTRDEDRYQGKAGLVLKKGPNAFVDDASTNFYGQNVESGDWIGFKASDGWPITVNGVLCRMLQDVHIRAKMPSPDMIW